MKITSLFISSESKNSEILVEFCDKNNIRLLRKSLISFQEVPFELSKPFDVVFFTSPRSFDFFSKNFMLKKDVPIACIGYGTKKHIEEYGYTVLFQGEEAGKPDKVAHEFSQWLAARIVLIPQSTISNKSIEKALNAKQIIPLVVYNTNILPLVIESCSVYIFTSPSNAISYFEKNKLPEKAIIIAWGQTTADYLEKKKVSNIRVLNESSFTELLDVLSNLLSNQN